MDEVRRCIPSSPLDSTHSLTTSNVVCHHIPWTANTDERRRAWNEITAVGLQAFLDDVGHGMTSPPLNSTHDRMTSGVACHHRLWTAHTLERHQAWHAIIAFARHTQSNNVGRGMTSPPLDSTHGQTTSGVACYHHLCAAHTIERRWAWHAIIALGRQTPSDDVRRYMPSPPLDSTHGRRRRA